MYIRLIGDRSIPESEFGKVIVNREQVIQKWSKKLREIQNKVSMAMIMANNHLEGFGPSTANTLRMQLGLEELIWDEKKQQRLKF